MSTTSPGCCGRSPSAGRWTASSTSPKGASRGRRAASTTTRVRVRVWADARTSRRTSAPGSPSGTPTPSSGHPAGFATCSTIAWSWTARHGCRPPRCGGNCRRRRTATEAATETCWSTGSPSGPTARRRFATVREFGGAGHRTRAQAWFVRARLVMGREHPPTHEITAPNSPFANGSASESGSSPGMTRPRADFVRRVDVSRPVR
ncbi:hypothetical protein RHCRD62_10481 [Rhodococcus sp. RD6.2]|nr:hypothetical protein RHCRD62_10481 [Rhodococcus sp. RD6.2]